MADDHNGRPRRPGRPDPVDYDVGYARPPPETRFKPGQSGNPGGRRKTKKVLFEDILADVAGRRTPIRLPDGSVGSVTFVEAAMVRTFQEAMKGNNRAAWNMFRLLEKTRLVDIDVEPANDDDDGDDDDDRGEVWHDED